MDSATKKDIILMDLEANGYQRIAQAVKDGWGSLPLQQYLKQLLTDTRNGDRYGFPKHIWDGILDLSDIHERHLLGIAEEPQYVIVKSKEHPNNPNKDSDKKVYF